MPVADPAPPELPRDRDGDGVADAADQCADIAAGPNPNPDHPGCPDGDDDRDGVFNHGDACPTEPAGLHADGARPGCPLADRDKDSVPDAEDHCPDKAGAPNPNSKKNGCPGLVMVTAQHLEIRKPVFFASKKDRILAKSNPVLQAVADALQATEAIRKISIEGHTDGQGTPAYNLDLSRRRAESVKAWLIAHGVAAERIEASGFGDTKPLTTNKTAAGRAANRRVEFVIVNPSSSSSTLSASDPS
jgi:outer membrane protein OmpA-like peptidoglycan-associated protein